MLEVPQIDLTRQAMLLGWLKQNGITQSSIAQALETSGQSVSRWMRAETIPSWRHEQLLKFGIPEELLPRPMNIPSGPKRPKKMFAPMLSHSPLPPALPH